MGDGASILGHFLTISGAAASENNNEPSSYANRDADLCVATWVVIVQQMAS